MRKFFNSHKILETLKTLKISKALKTLKTKDISSESGNFKVSEESYGSNDSVDIIHENIYADYVNCFGELEDSVDPTNTQQKARPSIFESIVNIVGICFLAAVIRGVALFLLCIIFILTTSCSFFTSDTSSSASGSSSSSDSSNGSSTSSQISSQSPGYTFLHSGWKMRAELKTNTLSADYPLIFEAYVDAAGNGEGLVEYNDNVYQVYIVNDNIYIQTSTNNIVLIEDLTGHLLSSNSSVGNQIVTTNDVIAKASDLQPLGFTVANGKVISYTATTEEFSITTNYQSDVSTFETKSLSQSNQMKICDFLKYFYLDKGEQTPYTDPGSSNSSTSSSQTVEAPASFYVKSNLGLTIRDTVYSIGDYCNPYDYFEGSTPQGMTTKQEWREDQLVNLTYVSYLSSDGESTFLTTDGYVQSINTTSDFSFLDVIKRDMTDTELKTLLGIDLRRSEKEKFKPILDGLTASKQNKGYTLKYKDMTITLNMNTKTKTLASITLSNYLDFRS